jgi:hypothetical protein
VAAFNLLRMRVIWFMGKISAVFLKKNVTWFGVLRNIKVKDCLGFTQLGE